jgi:hypothetical protein
MDDSIIQVLKILSINRQAFELLLGEKRRLRHEIVSVYTSSSSIWKQFPKDLSTEQRLSLLKALQKKYLAEIEQNQIFVDDQLLNAIRSFDMSERNKYYQSQMADMIYEDNQKVENIEQRYKQSTEIEKQNFSKKHKAVLEGIVGELEQLASNALLIDDVVKKFFGDSEKREKVQAIPEKIKAVVEKIKAVVEKIKA